jgi:ClpP class serine protease
VSKSNPPRQLTHVRAAIYGQPWAITESWLNSICEIAERHVTGEAVKFEPKAKVQAEHCPDCGYEMGEKEPPYEVRRGIAILPLDGPLFPRANLMTQLSGATSYQDFSAALDEAMQDDKVSAVLIHANSPGGSCLGMADICSKIYERRGGDKITIGLCDPMAASAAYAVVSQCTELFCTESAIVGSIGTIMRRDNWDRAERNAGNDPATIHSNELKAYGQPTSVKQYDDMVRTLSAYFEQFKEIVVRGRNGIDIDAVATGEVFVGREAVSRGLCDGVSTLHKIIDEFGA